MAKMDYSKIFIKDACPTSIGGQAVMDGIMMQGPEKMALAMRLPNHEIYVETEDKKPSPAALKVPMVRGAVAFFISLVQGMKVLMRSADILEANAPEEYETGKFEEWFGNKFGEKALWNFLMFIAVAFAFVIAIAGFVIFPTFAVNFLSRWTENAVVLNLIEGILRLLLFVLYVLAISRMDDVHVLFQYHGAEHKTIHCFENGLELTPENAQQFYTLHPRCGTSFLMFVFIISLVLFSFLGWPNLLYRIVSRILLIPVVAGISYELLKWAGRSDNIVVRILSWPGLMFQKLTTAEPNEEQLEVAIKALKEVLPGETPEVFNNTDEELIELFREKEEAPKQRNAAPEITDARPTEAIGIAPFKEYIFSPVRPTQEQKVPAGVRNFTINRYATDSRVIRDVLQWGAHILAGVPNGKNESRIILSYVTGLSQTDMIAHAADTISNADFDEYKRRLQMRLDGMPLQYITKVQEFMGLQFRVGPACLIPRLDTEILVENVIDHIEKSEMTSPRILDIGTGSGAIGIFLAHRFEGADVTLTDVDSDAMGMAISNSQINGVFRRCRFLIGDLFNAVNDTAMFDVIVSNPPYIRSDVIETLDREVKDHEPRLALDGGADGLYCYRRMIPEAGRHLVAGGLLAFEIGCDQAEAVSELIRKTGEFEDIRVIKDLAGLDRVVMAVRTGRQI